MPSKAALRERELADLAKQAEAWAKIAELLERLTLAVEALTGSLSAGKGGDE